MKTARRLCLALALTLGFASATKRPRSKDYGEGSRDDYRDDSRDTTATATASNTTVADPAIKSDNLYPLKRAIQTMGCLFSDAVACSGGFDDPIRYAAILSSNIFAKKHPEYEPIKSLENDLDSVKQLRNELARQFSCRRGNRSMTRKAGGEELLEFATKQLIGLASWISGEAGLHKSVFAATHAWDKHESSSDLISSAISEVFMAAEKASARFDRSVFVWPAGKSGNDPLHPEEQLYAAAVVIMCKKLGVRPVSVFLFTRDFERSLPVFRPSWRRLTLQVIAMVADVTVYGLDLADSCNNLIGQLGVSEKLNSVPLLTRHRYKRSKIHGKKSKKSNKTSIAGSAKPLTETLPTALGEGFAETDRLLLIRSLQVAYLLLNQTVADPIQLSNIFSQASTVISYLLLKLNDHDVPSDLVANKPEPDFGPLDLLRVIAEADRRPDLGAVATAGDVMIAAAQMIFRHLYLTLPVPVLAMAKQFNVVELPAAHFRTMVKLVHYLRIQDTPHIPSDSFTLTELCKTTDAILWAAFRVASVQRGSSSEAFVLYTREMSERISIERQHLDYLIPAILQKVLGDSTRSIEAAVLDLLAKIVPGPKDPSSLQGPRALPQEPVATPQGASISNPTGTIDHQIDSIYDQASTTENQIAMMADRAASMTKRAGDRVNQIAYRDSRNDVDQVLSKTLIVITAHFPDNNMLIPGLSDIPSMVLPFLPTDLARAGELTSANRLVMTLQLKNLDVKLKRDRIPSSETDHVTVLLDALIALQLLQQGAVFQLASSPRTRTSDIGLEDKGNLTLLLVAALFKATSMQPAEGSTSTAFSELTKRLASAVEATTSN